MKAKFNLPKKVIFCKMCLVSNQRPSSIPEFKHTVNRKNAKYLNINKVGVCDACLQNLNKKKNRLEQKREGIKKIIKQT